ncbi:MAG: DsbA family oxidoreductase [Acidimicrobiales bacterium]
MNGNFVVDVWSDVVCPFCYLGTRQLADALTHFEHRNEVIIRHRAFELDRNTPLHSERSLTELIARKYSMPVERVHEMHARIEGEARELGMEWSFDTVQPTNSFDAHRVIALGSSQGLGDEIAQRLFRAYFSEGQVISDHQCLAELSLEVGITGVDELWSSEVFVKEVRADENAAEELGITGVPCLLLDGKFMVVGARGAHEILDVLRRAWARSAA